MWRGSGAADVRDRTADLEADDQRADGQKVQVAEVRLAAGPGLVVIDSRTRAVFGTAAVPNGTTRDLTVSVPIGVTPSSELLVALPADDGDGRFGPATDGQVVDDEGEPVDENLDYLLR